MKTIYFTVGPVPTTQELAAAAVISGEVVLRNAEYVGPTDAIELCDAVAGAVPQIYIDYFKKPAGYFVDAPKDGNTYGRKDAAWDEVSGGGGGGGLTPSVPAYYRNSMLVALPPSEGTCEWGPVPDAPTFEALPNAAPYELSSTPLQVYLTGYAPNENGTFKATYLLEIISPSNVAINKKLFLADLDATDYNTEQFRHAYTLKVYESGESVAPKHISFDRYFVSNSDMGTFLAGVSDPTDFLENDYSTDTIALILSLNAGKYLIELEITGNNRSQYSGYVGIFANLVGGGSGGIINLRADDFSFRNKELMPTE